MGKYLTLVLLSIIPLKSISQDITVAVGRQIFYIGWKNKIAFSVDGYNKSQIMDFKVQGGKVFKEANQFYIIPDSREITISAKVKKKNNKIFWTAPDTFPATNISPQSMLGVRPSGIISKQELSYAREINVGVGYEIPDFYTKSSKMLIIGPQVLFFDSLDLSTLKNNDKRQMQRLNGGEFIYIYDVVAEVRETKYYPIYAEPCKLYVKSKQIPVNYKIVGYLRSNNKDSEIEIRTSYIEEDELENIYKGYKTGNWKLYFEDVDSSRIISQFEFIDNTIVKIKNYNDSGVLSFEEIRSGKKCARNYFDKGGSLALHYEYYSDESNWENYMIDEHGELKEPWEMDTSKYGLPFQILFGKWQQYFPNGRIQEEGNFDTITKSFVDTIGVVADPYDPRKLIKGTVYKALVYVKNGVWKYYNDDGTVAKMVTYNMGQASKD